MRLDLEFFFPAEDNYLNVPANARLLGATNG